MRSRIAALLPGLGSGVRAAIATVIPFYLARRLEHPGLVWMALGGWLGSLADPGGTRHQRARAMTVFVLAGAGLVLAGALASSSSLASVLVLAAAVFATSMARAFGGEAAKVGSVLTIVVAIAAQATSAPPVESAALFGLGALWAVLLSSIIWPVWPHLPLRRPTAEVYAQLAAYTDAIADAARSGDGAAWSELAREHQRAVRAALEVASAAMVALRADHLGESVVGANTRTILGEAEAEFFKLIGYADELETRAAVPGDLEVLAELSRSYREIYAQLLTRLPGTWRPTATHDTPSRLARALVTTSRAVVDVSRTLDERPENGTRSARDEQRSRPPTVARGTSSALPARDAFSLRSPIFQHAVRVTATGAVALIIGRLASPKHAQWVSITALAVTQPYLGLTITRVIERVAGTIVGSALAVGLIATVATPLATALAMFPLAVISVVLRPRSYRLFVAFLTPVFLLVADHWKPTYETAAVRTIDAAIGGAIAIIAAIVKPSWEHTRLPDALADALAAVSAYVTRAFAGAPRRQLGAARRDVGVALETAEASLERMLAEPPRLQRGAAEGVFLLTYARRISGAVTALDESLAAHPGAARPARSAELRDYILAELAAATRFATTGETTPPLPIPDADPALARVVHYAELVGRVARPTTA